MNKEDCTAPKYKMLMRACVRMFLFALCSVIGMAKAFPAMRSHRRQQIADVMLNYLNNSASVINHPGRADAVTLHHMVACVGLTHELEIVKGSGEMTLTRT